MCLNFTVLMQLLGYNKKQLSRIKREQIILNIGCLANKNKDYVNADLVPVYGIRDIVKIILKKSELDCELVINLTYHDRHLSGFANSVILSHVLEHIHPQLAITALKNCFSYLKSGGYIRVTVPYLGAYNQPNLATYQNVEDLMLATNKLIYGYGHQFMYDAKLVIVLMEEAGFSEVKEVTFARGVLGETDLTERQPESIYLTGVKT